VPSGVVVWTGWLVQKGIQAVSRVFVAGSVIMDLVATAARHPKVGETVLGDGMHFFPGGKGANQAVAAARLDAHAILIGSVGDDDFGRQMRTFLTAQRVDLQHLRISEAMPTGTALIVVAGHDNAIVVVPSANAEISANDVSRADIGAGDVLLAQLEIPLSAVAAFFARGRAAGARTIFNPAPALAIDRELLALADIIILNETELAAFTQRQVDANAAAADIAGIAKSLRCRADQIICVTLGARGAIAVIDGDTCVVPGRVVDAVDTTGAGDCFAGAVAAELARGSSVRETLAFANAAASLCVQRMGAGPSMPLRAEVEKALGG
jgi:ribokinase